MSDEEDERISLENREPIFLKKSQVKQKERMNENKFFLKMD